MKNLNMRDNNSIKTKFGLLAPTFLGDMLNRDYSVGQRDDDEDLSIEPGTPENVPIEYLCLLYRL